LSNLFNELTLMMQCLQNYTQRIISTIQSLPKNIRLTVLSIKEIAHAKNTQLACYSNFTKSVIDFVVY